MEKSFSSTAVFCCVGRCPKIIPISSHDITKTTEQSLKVNNYNAINGTTRDLTNHRILCQLSKCSNKNVLKHGHKT